MGTFPEAYPDSLRHTAIELLREAAQAGKNRSQATSEVAEAFTDGPSASTLVNWARQENIFAPTRRRVEAEPVEIDETPAGSQRYSEEFKRETAEKLADLINSEDLSLRGASLRLIEQDPGAPSVPTLRKWANTYLEFETADDTESEPVEDESQPEPTPEPEPEPELEVEAAPKKRGGSKRRKNGAEQPDAELAAIVARLNEENARLKAHNTELAAAAEETTLLRGLVRHYMDV